MAAEFGQSEDVWQSGISCGGGWFANSISCGRGYFANSIAYGRGYFADSIAYSAVVSPTRYLRASATLAWYRCNLVTVAPREEAHPRSLRSARSRLRSAPSFEMMQRMTGTLEQTGTNVITPRSAFILRFVSTTKSFWRSSQ